jgi:hypothetical protein
MPFFGFILSIVVRGLRTTYWQLMQSLMIYSNILSIHNQVMSKHILFVCQSCHHSSEERPKDQPADGDRLLEQLNRLGAE